MMSTGSLNGIKIEAMRLREILPRDKWFFGLSAIVRAALLEDADILFLLRNPVEVNRWVTDMFREMAEKRRKLTKTELWKLGVPIDLVDNIIAVANVRVREVLRSLERDEVLFFDNLSVDVIKYAVEHGVFPSVEDLVKDLDFRVFEAKVLLNFVREVMETNITFSKSDFSDEEIRKVDEVAVKVLEWIDKYGEGKVDILRLCAETNCGIWLVKNAISYIEWVGGVKVDPWSLSDEERQNMEQVVLKVVRRVMLRDIPLSLRSIVVHGGVRPVEFAAKVLAYINSVLSMKVDVDKLDKKLRDKAEEIARRIAKAKDEGKIESYEDVARIMDALEVGLFETKLGIEFLTQKILKEKLVPVELPMLADEKVKVTEFRVEVEDRIFDVVREPVEVVRGFDYEGGFIRFKVVVRNFSDFVISDVEIRLRLREHVRVVSISPRDFAKDRSYAYIPSMVPKQKQSVDFYLEPLICGEIPVEVLVIYRDAVGNTHTIVKEPKFVSTKCPPIVPRGETNYANLDNLYRNVLAAKAKRSFSAIKEFKRFYEHIIEVLESWAGRSTKRIYSDRPFRADAYFMVDSQVVDLELGRQEMIVLKVEVNEDNRVANVSVAADKQKTATGILIHVWHNLLEPRFKEIYGLSLKPLICPECGAPFGNIDIGVDFVSCRFCGRRFQVRTLVE